MNPSNRSPFIITSLDLELNPGTWEIIQIGACVGDLRTGTIFNKISMHIKTPNKLNVDTSNGLCDITKLTGITQKDVDNGVELIDAYKVLSELHNSSYKYDDIWERPFRNCLVWGGGDTTKLKDELIKINGLNEEFCFGHRFIDVKTIFQFHMLSTTGELKQGGLSKSMGRIGLQFKGKIHNALDDSFNTFRVYKALYDLNQSYMNGK